MMVAYLLTRLPELCSHLDEPAWLLARQLLLRVRLDDHESAVRAWSDFLDLLRRHLPEGHEVRLRIAAELGHRGSALSLDELDTLREALAGLADLAVDEEVFRAREALLETPVLEAGQVRDPDVPELLWLPRGDGTRVAPAFQFDAAGALLPTVRAVNAILGAGLDPWGAAGWWLGANALLNGVPAGNPTDARLVEAAEALLEDC
ncbi:hypothetical protein [Nonomuraea typhae]|uniref:Uncharacterized protein n=1 Tax=Nonomuraea typhae TaxID=2603600 RepID=A0ABW7YR42_9ACTN